MIRTSSFSGSNLKQSKKSMMRKKRGGGRNRRKKRTRRRRGRGRDGNPPAHVGPYVRADDSSLMNKGAYLARLQLAARLALERRVARDAQLAKNEKYMNELLEFSDDEHKKGGNRRKKRTRRRRGRGISQSKPREEKEDARAAAHLRRLDEIQEELDFKIACMKRFMNSASTNDIDKVQRLQERNFVKAAYAAMIKWCKENPTNPMNIGGRRTRKKRGKGPQQRAVAGKFVGNILSKYKPKAKRKSRGPKKANRAPRPVIGDIVEVEDFFLSLSPTFNQVSDEYYGGDHGPKWFLARLMGGANAAAAAPQYQIQLLNAAGEDAGQGIQYVLRIRFPPGDGGRNYTAGQSGGSSRNRRTRKKCGKGPQQRAVAGKFVGNILSKYKPKAKPKARRKKSHTAKKADHAPRPPPQRPVAGDIVEVQDFFLSLSPTLWQVSNEYYEAASWAARPALVSANGAKWFLARVTGGDAAAGGGGHGRRGYQIQLLNAAGEDAGQGLQYVAQVRAQDGRTYTWRGPAN